ncbi:Signal transduction histidine kinase [Promicromonospora umidemergens]|uniref:histidine kinase n=1 Tax=Promicromonospora umidemergens TaxID=629679 RepID=A0ABP8WST9_9MICO|nr:histidine kinase [Promicromonospora umidemergens]MCP2283365.1 Signal transduction histidine kinase [Promicromonospora umidemergens]
MSGSTGTRARPPGQAGRDRLADGVLILVAASLGLVAVILQVNEPWPGPAWLLFADRSAGVLGCLALWWRRRFPLVLGIALPVASSFSETVAGAAIVALFTVAVHRSARATAVVCALSLAALSTYQLLWPEPSTPPLTVFTIIGLGHLAVVAWGMSLRNRRALVTSLRERAVAAEVEARLRAERSEHEAREALAREMHDVLGHRLSLLSVHAGALAYSRDASAADRARAAEVVRENAHRALQDLREVIGVLRAPVGELPLPGVEDVLELIDEARQAGTPVELRDDAGVTTRDRTLPDTQGRTLYRVVQECLTNVRKHAPGASVVVRIAGRPGGHVTAEVVNASPTDPPAHPQGSGAGLRGLGERARLVGGQLDHGPTGSGGWQVRIRLPWPP